jgi:hypothetical protein
LLRGAERNFTTLQPRKFVDMYKRTSTIKAPTNLIDRLYTCHLVLPKPIPATVHDHRHSTLKASSHKHSSLSARLTSLVHPAVQPLNRCSPSCSTSSNSAFRQYIALTSSCQTYTLLYRFLCANVSVAYQVSGNSLSLPIPVGIQSFLPCRLASKTAASDYSPRVRVVLSQHGDR